jgi:hypothetical protein
LSFLPHMPSEKELRELAIRIFFEENPEATTNPEEYELRAPEGHYYLEAQRRAMSGIRDDLLKTLSAYEEEVTKTVEALREIGETPTWPPPKPEELEQKVTSLENQLSRAKTNITRLSEEKENIEKELAEIKKKAEPPKRNILTVKIEQFIPAFIGTDKKTYGPFYPGQIVELPEADATYAIRQAIAQPYAKPPSKDLYQEAKNLWNEYRTALLNNETQKATDILARLKTIRPQVLAQL